MVPSLTFAVPGLIAPMLAWLLMTAGMSMPLVPSPMWTRSHWFPSGSFRSAPTMLSAWRGHLWVTAGSAGVAVVVVTWKRILKSGERLKPFAGSPAGAAVLSGMRICTAQGKRRPLLGSTHTRVVWVSQFGTGTPDWSDQVQAPPEFVPRSTTTCCAGSAVLPVADDVGI